MAYTVNRTDGSVLTVVADGTIDTTSDLQLIGKNYAGYGEAQNEDFVALLENFANTTAPAKPLSGQLWYDTSSNALNVYSGATWSLASGVEASASPPGTPAAGDLWFDTTTDQLKVYDGTIWIIVGPQYASGVKTGALVETIVDDAAGSHVVTTIYVEDVRVAIISSDSVFTPDPVVTGFVTILPGHNLSSTVAGAKYNGTATDSDALGGVLATNYLRADANDSTSGQLSIINDNGLALGADSDLALTVAGSVVNFKNVTSNADIVFGINMNTVPTDSITIDGATNTTTIHGDFVAEGDFSITGDIVGTHNGDIVITANNTTNETVYLTFVDGATGPQGLETDVSLYYNPSTNILNTTAVAAQYADIAEHYTTDEEYAPGTVVQVAGDLTVDAKAFTSGMHVIGVISTNPAFAMNIDAGGQAVGLTGRVPTRVTGFIAKGDIVYADESNPGTATVGVSGPSVGVALEAHDNIGEGVIECILHLNK